MQDIHLVATLHHQEKWMSEFREMFCFYLATSGKNTLFLQLENDNHKYHSNTCIIKVDNTASDFSHV